MNKYIKEAIEKMNGLDSDLNDSIHYGILEEVVVKDEVIEILKELSEKLEPNENKLKPADLYKSKLDENPCGLGNKSCYLCVCNDCAAGQGDDEFRLASKDQLIKRYLASGKYDSAQKKHILKVLKKYYDFQLD